MVQRSLLVLAALSLLLVAAPAQAAGMARSIDLKACVASFTDPFAYCSAGFGPSCTSTSACLGANVAETWKDLECVNATCSPWLPSCVTVTVWFQDRPESPRVDQEICSPVVDVRPAGVLP